MVYGPWSGARGAQNKDGMEGILTKGVATKRHPRAELATSTLPLHGSPQLRGFSGGRFTPGSAEAGSSCSHGALDGLDGAWEVVCCYAGNGARARLLRWGKVVVQAMRGFFYRSRSPDGRGTMP
jgi:hypothetical protein